jgi:hypothetical protein
MLKERAMILHLTAFLLACLIREDPTALVGPTAAGNARRENLVLEALLAAGVPRNDPALPAALRFVHRSSVPAKVTPRLPKEHDNDGFLYPLQCLQTGGTSQARWHPFNASSRSLAARHRHGEDTN